MRKIVLALLVALLVPAVARADIMPNPYVIQTLKRCSGTITSGTVSQTAISAANNAGSKFWYIQNPSSASEDLFVDMGEASGTTSIDLAAGQSLSMGGQAIWQGSVTVYATTTSHAFICFYGQ